MDNFIQLLSLFVPIDCRFDVESSSAGTNKVLIPFLILTTYLADDGTRKRSSSLQRACILASSASKETCGSCIGRLNEGVVVHVRSRENLRFTSGGFFERGMDFWERAATRKDRSVEVWVFGVEAEATTLWSHSISCYISKKRANTSSKWAWKTAWNSACRSSKFTVGRAIWMFRVLNHTWAPTKYRGAGRRLAWHWPRRLPGQWTFHAEGRHQCPSSNQWIIWQPQDWHLLEGLDLWAEALPVRIPREGVVPNSGERRGLGAG